MRKPFPAIPTLHFGWALQNGAVSVELIDNLFYRMRQSVIQVIDTDSAGDCSTM